jgi:hypothetical protein
MKLVVTPAPLVPRLSCIRRPNGKFDLSEGFHPTDLLHVTRACEGFEAGTILPVLGWCRSYDAEGLTYAVRAYVPGFGTTVAGRESQRFPTAFQQEELFVALPPYFTEIDITDNADCLAMERLHEAVIIPMYPTEGHMRLSVAA